MIRVSFVNILLLLWDRQLCNGGGAGEPWNLWGCILYRIVRLKPAQGSLREEPVPWLILVTSNRCIYLAGIPQYSTYIGP